MDIFTRIELSVERDCGRLVEWSGTVGVREKMMTTD